MPRIASKHPGFAISHSHRDALSTLTPNTLHVHTQPCSASLTHTKTHQVIVSESQDFHPPIIPPVMKDSLSAIPSSSSVFSLAQLRPLNHTSPISVRTFLLFPRQQWKKIFPRRTQPMALAVVWVLVLSGSVELAACVCACFRSESMGGQCRMCRYALLHSCLNAFVQENVENSVV